MYLHGKADYPYMQKISSQNSQNSLSLPPPKERGEAHNRILAAKLRNNYEKIDPSAYGYHPSPGYGAKARDGYEYKIKPPVISTINDRGSAVVGKPSWWG